MGEVFGKTNGEAHYLWRAVDNEGEVLKSFVAKCRDRKAVLKFLSKTTNCHGRIHIFVTETLLSCGAAIKVIGNVDRQEIGDWLDN